MYIIVKITKHIKLQIFTAINVVTGYQIFILHILAKREQYKKKKTGNIYKDILEDALLNQRIRRHGAVLRMNKDEIPMNVLKMKTKNRHLRRRIFGPEKGEVT